MDMPQNPIMLRSIVNTALRDEFDSLEALCDDKGWSIDEVINILESAGFSYIKEANQFR